MRRIDPPATPQRRVADPFGRPVNTPAGRAMAEAQRRNAFESMLQDRDQYAPIVTGSVARVTGFGLGIGALIRRAKRWVARIVHIKELCEEVQQGVRPADGAPVFETWDAWTKYQNAAEHEAQLNNIVDCFTVGALVQLDGTEENRTEWENCEDSSVPFQALEAYEQPAGLVVFDAIRIKVRADVETYLRQFQARQQAVQQQQPQSPGRPGREALLAEIPPGLTNVVLRHYLDGIAASGDASISFEAMKNALKRYSALLGQFVQYTVSNRQRVATEGEPTFGA